MQVPKRDFLLLQNVAQQSGVLSLLLLSLFAAGSCSAPEKEAESPESEPVVSVEAVPVLSTAISQKVSAEGVLFPVRQAAIVPKITAPVHAFHVERGSMVKAGQLLAELESQDLADAIAENRAELAQAEAAYETTSRVSVPQQVQRAELDVRAARDVLDAQQKRYDSLQELYRQGAIAQKEVNEALATLTQARNQAEIADRVLRDLNGFAKDQAIKEVEARRDAARLRVQSSQTQLGYAKLVSPIAGIVADRPLFNGETAVNGSPLLTVMDLSSVIARAHVPQREAANIREGQAASLLSQDGIPVATGKVIQVSPVLDPSSTTVEVWVEAANPNLKLKAGESLTVQIVVKSDSRALVIPESALVTGASGSSFVMVVDEGDKPRKQTVTLGIHDAGNVQVIEGLKGGDRVVGRGVYELSKLDADVLQKTSLQIQVPKEEEEDEEEE